MILPGESRIDFILKKHQAIEMNSESNYSRLDVAFARFLGQRALLNDEQRSTFESLLMQLSAQQAAGHSCIQINEQDRALLQASGLVSDSETMPLIVDKNRLYTRRYWFYEQRLAVQIRALCKQQFSYKHMEDKVDHYFKPLPNETDWQREAAKKALTQAFSIITGGPGTGKTTTVVKILALLQESSKQPLHIALVAPTGKAATRLQESVGLGKAGLPCTDVVKKHIPEQVTTIHHLLGAKPPTPYFKHDAATPLPFDLVVVDEASMVDLALMSKLVDALKPGARLILLGDKDQLASVESGAVLADLTTGLPGHTLELLKSHRFQGEIKVLADMVNQQQAEQAWQLLQKKNAAITLLVDEIIEFIAVNYSCYLQLIDQGADFQSVFAAFNQFQALCSNRNGPQSVADINVRVEHCLQAQNKIHVHGRWYVGRPVMVTENNASMQLYNGDIGLCLQDPQHPEQLRVFFLRPDGSIKKVLPARLPKCETVYAMTIHKSQGSEFESVLIILAEQMNPVLTKELLYTAITRAKSLINMVTTEAVFIETVRQKVLRGSGLVDKLI